MKNSEEDTGAAYQTLFRRTSTNVLVGYDDFKILSIIGKGTFGKVKK